MYWLILIIAIETVIIIMGWLAWDHGVDAAIEEAALIAESYLPLDDLALDAAAEIRALKTGGRK